jgi:hypothetical protein
MSGDFDSAYERALDVRRRLREAWAQTREEWTDAVSVEFEQSHWIELDLQVSKLLNAASELAASLEDRW